MESSVGIRLKEYLKDCSFYAEVKHRKKRADAVFIQDGVNIVEIKTRVSFKVIEQADNWKRLANRVYVCVPYVKSNYSILTKICKSIGIGLFTYTDDWIVLNHIPDKREVTRTISLHEEQMMNVAGSMTADKPITPFRITVMRCVKYLQDNENCYAIDLFKSIAHHYRSDKIAVSTFVKRIREGLVPELTAKKENRRWIINLVKTYIYEK